MKLSCLPVSFFPAILEGRMTVAEWARLGAAIGLDAIDLSIALVPDRSASGLATLRCDIEAAGLGVTMVTSYPDFTHPDPEQRKRELALEQDVVRVAAVLGAKYVRATAGQAHPKTGHGEGIAWAVEGLSQLIKTTRSSGVTIVYENHAKPFIWQYTDFSRPPDIFLEIVHRTADCGLGVNFDTANATAFAEDPVSLLAEVVQRVVTVHAADTAVRGTLEMVLLGTGLVPFTEIFGTLKGVGFDGWICMEEGSCQGQAGVEAAAQFVRRTWNEA